MKSSEFNTILSETLSNCVDTLSGKAKEYAAEDDRLRNFKVAAELQKCSPQKALSGMMAKHTISVYDMCRSDEYFDISLWAEKITDSINYLLLLKAIISEDGLGDQNSTESVTVPKNIRLLGNKNKQNDSLYVEKTLNFCESCIRLDDCSDFSMGQTTGCIIETDFPSGEDRKTLICTL